MVLKRKNIAIISDQYYPDMSAPSAVIDKYVQVLKNEKYTFHIITVSYDYDFIPLLDSNVKIYYVKSFKSRLRAWGFDCIRKKKNKFLAHFSLFLVRCHTLCISQIAYPFTTKWLIPKYHRTLEEIHSRVNLDCVITVSNTICSQFAGLKFKNNHPNIKWITFFTDPFTDHYIYYPFFKYKKSLRARHFKDEMMIYNTADYNMLTKELYDRAINNFNQPLHKTSLIEFTLNRQIYKNTIVNSFNYGLTQRVSLVYAGALYKNIRNPEGMLKIVSQTKGVKLDLYIKHRECSDIVDRYLSEFIVRKSLVNREKYLQMINDEYDILVNIGNISSLQTPSKMLELLSTGKPIVNFYVVKDVQYYLLEKYPLGINLDSNDSESISKLECFCRENRGKRLSFDQVISLYPENCLETQVKLLKGLIDI